MKTSHRGKNFRSYVFRTGSNNLGTRKQPESRRQQMIERVTKGPGNASAVCHHGSLIKALRMERRHQRTCSTEGEQWLWLKRKDRVGLARSNSSSRSCSEHVIRRKWFQRYAYLCFEALNLKGIQLWNLLDIWVVVISKWTYQHAVLPVNM